MEDGPQPQWGCWPPRPVLQQQVRVFTPLSNGEGMGVGLLASAPHPPTTSKAIHSPLPRGGGSRALRGAGVGLMRYSPQR